MDGPSNEVMYLWSMVQMLLEPMHLEFGALQQSYRAMLNPSNACLWRRAGRWWALDDALQAAATPCLRGARESWPPCRRLGRC